MTNNKEFDYTLRFEPIRNRNGYVRLIDNHTGSERDFDFTINDQDFDFRLQHTVSPAIADLIDIAASIYASDRLVPQKQEKKARYIHVFLPVRNVDLMTSTKFQKKLEDLLWWATSSIWVFHFQELKTLERDNEVQGELTMLWTKPVDEVALWSGGLDALAGLYNRLHIRPSKSFLIFGSGGNKQVYKQQQVVADLMKEKFPDRIMLSRLLIRFNGCKGYKMNQASRARGIVFMLLGSACALLIDRKELYVYENGIGAMNLPYRSSEVGIDHTRSVHPWTLLQLSHVISELVEEKFKIINPFLFSTKAEMCQRLAENSEYRFGRSNTIMRSQRSSEWERQSSPMWILFFMSFKETITCSGQIIRYDSIHCSWWKISICQCQSLLSAYDTSGFDPPTLFEYIQASREAVVRSSDGVSNVRGYRSSMCRVRKPVSI